VQYWSPPLEFGTNRAGHHAVHSAWSYNLDMSRVEAHIPLYEKKRRILVTEI
jgi:hypothetical protein